MCDIAVVGGGHNGLVYATYPAAPEVGGTVWRSASVPARLKDRPWDGSAKEEAGRMLAGVARIVGTDLCPLIVGHRVVGPAFFGAGMLGVPGRSTAKALLSDLGSRPCRTHRLRRDIKGLWDAWELYRSMRKRI